jgi:hypothetical protein
MPKMPKMIMEKSSKVKETYPENLTEESKKKAIQSKKKMGKQLEEAKKDAKVIVPPKMRKPRKDKGVKRKRKGSSSSMTKEDGQSGMGYNPPPTTY